MWSFTRKRIDNDYRFSHPYFSRPYSRGYDKNALGEVARDVEYFAKKEGLTAHARSAVIRFEDEAEAK